MSDCVVLDVAKLGFPWQTSDPFLFCVYHDDLFPPGDKDLGPAIPQHLLWRGRNRGADFGGKWNMYHGEKVCGYPVPHCCCLSLSVSTLRTAVRCPDFHGTRIEDLKRSQWCATG